MSPDNSVQNFLPSHIWLIYSRRRAQDSCLIIPVTTDCAASFERSPGREYHQKMTLRVWHNERRPSEGGGTFNEMKQLSTNLQIFSGRSEILCFIQVMLPVSALDNCIIRAESPLLRGRGRTGDGAWGISSMMTAFWVVGRLGAAVISQTVAGAFPFMSVSSLTSGQAVCQDGPYG